MALMDGDDLDVAERAQERDRVDRLRRRIIAGTTGGAVALGVAFAAVAAATNPGKVSASTTVPAATDPGGVITTPAQPGVPREEQDPEDGVVPPGGTVPVPRAPVQAPVSGSGSQPQAVTGGSGG